MDGKGCGRYGCDGLHFPVVQYCDRRTGELLSARPLDDLADERTCEYENVPDGQLATLAYTRCLTCNPRPIEEAPAPRKVLAGVGARSIEDDEGEEERPSYRLPYADN